MNKPPPSPAIEVVEIEQVEREREEQERLDEEIQAELVRDRKWFSLFLELLESGRMDEDWVYLMVQIGAITDRAEVLPCQDRTRENHAYNWPHDRQKELELRAREAAGEVFPIPEDESPPERWRRLESRQLRPTHYKCPIMSMVRYHSAPLPCIEAQRRQQELRDDPDDPPYLLAKDPVVELEFRPCYVIGERALHAILSPNAVKRAQAMQHRKPPKNGEA